MNSSLAYGFGKTVELGYDQAVAKTKEALASEGFGVLTEINVRETLKKKLGVDFRPYVILGACNPHLAHRALSAELDIGLLLPCNVIVYASEDDQRTAVAIMDPEVALELTGNREIGELAGEVKERLQSALARV